MAGYEDTKQKIISALMGRPNGTEIQPENHQDYVLNMLDYIRSLELIATSTLIGVAESNTIPVQPDSSRVCYISGIAQNKTVAFENFRAQNGNPISITTGDMEGLFVILMWNGQYWSAQTFATNIISQSESATFYYRYNIRKTYPSVSAMNANVTNPVGTDGKSIKVGDIVTVSNNSTPSENGIYSYEGVDNGWKFQSGMNFGIAQELGNNPNVAISQKAISNIIAYVHNETYSILNDGVLHTYVAIRNLDVQKKYTCRLKLSDKVNLSYAILIIAFRPDDTYKEMYVPNGADSLLVELDRGFITIHLRSKEKNTLSCEAAFSIAETESLFNITQLAQNLSQKNESSILLEQKRAIDEEAKIKADLLTTSQKVDSNQQKITGIVYSETELTLKGSGYNVVSRVVVNENERYNIHVKFSEAIANKDAVMLVWYNGDTYGGEKRNTAGTKELTVTVQKSTVVQLRELQTNVTACTAEMQIISTDGISSKLDEIYPIVNDLNKDVYDTVYHNVYSIEADGKSHTHASVGVDVDKLYTVRLTLSEPAVDSYIFTIIVFDSAGKYTQATIASGANSLTFNAPAGTKNIQFRTSNNNTVTCSAVLSITYQNAMYNVCDRASSFLKQQLFQTRIPLPSCSFVRDSYTLPAGNYSCANVGNQRELQDVVASLTGQSKVMLRLTSDIRIATTINIPNGASVIIDCLGHALYEYHDPLSCEGIVDGMSRYICPIEFSQKMKFISNEGKNLFISRSEAYKSVAHTYVNDTNLGDHFQALATLTLPNELHELKISESDNVYVTIRSNFVDTVGLVTGVENGILTLKVLSNSYSISSTYVQHPYFFFINLDCSSDGHAIMRNDLLYTSCDVQEVSVCTLNTLFHVSRGGFLKITNASNISGGIQYAIQNEGTLVLASCSLSSPFGAAVIGTTDTHTFISACTFIGYNSNIITDLYKKSYFDITNCVFKNLGLYSQNIFAVFISNSHAYVADNVFENINYGAICCGNNDTITSLEKTGIRLVERNTIINTSDFISKKNRFGLFDGGAIYVGCSNKETTIRYNTILRFGGTSNNHGIYMDDGAYNVKVYGNVISCINDSSWDITSRYESRWYSINPETGKPYGRGIPDDCDYCTNNFIAYNIFDGAVKMQANTSVADAGCTYYMNVKVDNTGGLEKNTISPNANLTGVIYDTVAYIDASGHVKSSNNYGFITSNL